MGAIGRTSEQDSKSKANQNRKNANEGSQTWIESRREGDRGSKWGNGKGEYNVLADAQRRVYRR